MDGSVIAGADATSTSPDDDAFVAALQVEMGRLRRVARLLVSDSEVADDLVGEAIARTLPRWRSGKVGDVGAYVRQVMVNLAARRWRRRLLGRRRDHAALGWLPASSEASDVLAERDRTLQAVMQLPVRRRAVVCWASTRICRCARSPPRSTSPRAR